MYNFDVMIGVDQGILNDGISALYKNSSAREKYFKGSEQGDFTLSYDVLSAPSINLATPSQTDWDASIQKVKGAKLPEGNCFQVHFPSVSGSVAVADSVVSGSGVLDVYMTASICNGALRMEAVAVKIDQNGLSEFDKWMTKNIAVPFALTKTDALIGLISIPNIPSYQGISFNVPTISIINGQLMVGTTMISNKNPLSFDGFKPPNKKYYALLSQGLINLVAQANLNSYNGYKKSDSVETGNEAVWAKGTYDFELNSIVATAETNDLTKIDINITTSISVSGSAGGILPALACPVSAALNAL